MFGLDDAIASYSDGTSLLLVALVAVLLGLRHATDPDHLAAVTTLVASSGERAAVRLGLAWGAGHALSLFAFGLPILLFERYLPELVQHAAETAVALLIVYLGVRLLVRSKRPVRPRRTTRAAFGIGLVHGMGGSAGVGVLIVASVESTPLEVVALALLAAFTAISMATVTSGFGHALVRRPAGIGAPVLGTLSLAFGAWYAGAAWSVFPYPF